MTLERLACILPAKGGEAAGGGCMRLGVVVWMGCAMLLATGAVAGARGERELSDDELRGEMAINRALAAYVQRNGEPDLAETHFLADRGPWDDHEVTLYYLRLRARRSGSRARGSSVVRRSRSPATSGRSPTSRSPRSRRGRTARSRRERARSRRPRRGRGPGGRAAAGKVEAAADSAEHAADSAEAAANKMESAFHRSLR
jgi:hypothetical protein